MYKRLTGLLLSLVILFIAVIAYAEIPSKTTNDLVKAIKVIAADGTVLDGVVTVSDVPSEMAVKQLSEIAAFVSNGNTVVNYFPDYVKTQITSLIPANIDPSTLLMNEYVDLTLGNYQDSYGDVTNTIIFATEYQADQVVIALVGYPDETGKIIWQALQARVVDGMLQITFPADLLKKLGSDVILSVLST